MVWLYVHAKSATYNPWHIYLCEALAKLLAASVENTAVDELIIWFGVMEFLA